MKWQEGCDELRQMRDSKERDSLRVVQLWLNCVQQSVDKLGDEKWTVLEQVCVAGLDSNNMSVAENCLLALTKQFSGSVRVRKLKAQRLEALNRYDDALTIYEAILAVDETNLTVRKRLVAVHKAQGDTVQAISTLVNYLNMFQDDTEAWDELCDLYIGEQEYARAAFCMEESLLHNAHSHLHHQKYADIRYTQGGVDNMEVARCYYARAVKLSSAANLRAIFGLILCCSFLSNSQKTSAQRKQECTKTLKMMSQLVKDKYAQAGCEDSLNGLTLVMDSLSLSSTKSASQN